MGTFFVVAAIITAFMACRKFVDSNYKYVGSFLKDENGLDNMIVIAPGKYEIGLRIDNDSSIDEVRTLTLIKEVSDGKGGLKDMYFDIYSSNEKFSVSLVDAIASIKVKDGKIYTMKIRKRYFDPSKGLGEVGYIIIKGDSSVEEDKCHILSAGVGEKS